jgi:hypothetical protein
MKPVAVILCHRICELLDLRATLYQIGSSTRRLRQENSHSILQIEHEEWQHPQHHFLNVWLFPILCINCRL